MGALTDAAYNLCRHQPGGARQLGERMGKSNLADEVNPNLPRSKLGADDMLAMEVLSGDHRCLRAHARELRYFPPIPMPEGFDEEAEPCMQTLAKLIAEFGGLVTVVSQDSADGEYTNTELARALKEADDLQLMVVKLIAQLTAMNAATNRRAQLLGGAA